MMMWLLLNIKEIGILTLGFFSLLTLWCNRNLKKKNNDLQEQVKDNSKLIDIQAKVLNVSELVKDVDLDGNIKRMQDDKL